MLSLDGTFLVIFFSFVIFMLFMKSQFFGPIMAIKNERETTVSSGHQVSAEAKSKAEQLIQAADAQVAEAKRKAHELISEKRNQAKAKANDTLTNARNTSVANYESQAKALKDRSETVYNQLQDNRQTLVKAVIERISNSQTPVAS